MGKIRLRRSGESSFWVVIQIENTRNASEMRRFFYIPKEFTNLIFRKPSTKNTGVQLELLWPTTFLEWPILMSGF